MIAPSATSRLAQLNQSRASRFAVDLRSEVMVPPTDDMWEAMRSASTHVEWPFGDGDDYIAALEEECAKLMGQEAALFVPTTSMANLAGILSLSAQGQHVVLGAASHIFSFERQNICSLGGRVPRLVAESRRGELPSDQIDAVLRNGPYDTRANVGVIALENTHNVRGGTYLTPAYVEAVSDLARKNGVRLFVDGARIMNSAVAQGVPLEALAGPADGVSMSLNKGLGAPYGGILAATRETVERARDHVWSFGGHSVHRAGIFAAAALVALDQGVEQIHKDHAAARQLAEALASVEGIEVDLELVETNLVRVELRDPSWLAAAVVKALAEFGIGASLSDPRALRFVTHRGFDARDVPKVREGLVNAVSFYSRTSDQTGRARAT